MHLHSLLSRGARLPYYHGNFHPKGEAVSPISMHSGCALHFGRRSPEVLLQRHWSVYPPSILKGVGRGGGENDLKEVWPLRPRPSPLDHVRMPLHTCRSLCHPALLLARARCPGCASDPHAAAGGPGMLPPQAAVWGSSGGLAPRRSRPSPLRANGRGRGHVRHARHAGTGGVAGAGVARTCCESGS